MQIVVQEGEASVSLIMPIQAPDESLRTTRVHSVAGPVKVVLPRLRDDPGRGARGRAGDPAAGDRRRHLGPEGSPLPAEDRAERRCLAMRAMRIA